MNYTDNWLATKIIFTFQCFEHFLYVSVLVHVSFFVESYLLHEKSYHIALCPRFQI